MHRAVKAQGIFAKLKRAGIRTGVLIAPLIPGVNDSPQQVEPLLGRWEAGRYTVVLAQGRKREIRRLFQALGRGVRRLCRVQYGPLELGTLAAGAWRYLTADEVEALRRAGDK